MIRLVLGALYFVSTWFVAKSARYHSFEKRYGAARKCSRRFLKVVDTKLECNEFVYPKGPILFVSNHQGTIDPLLLIAAINKPMTFISKQENKKIPIINSWARVLGLIYFDRNEQSSAIKMLRETTRWLKDGNSILVFPEGTRSKSKHVYEFHEASLKPAYLAQATIVPITLHNAYTNFENMKHKIPYKITIGKARTYQSYCNQDLKLLANELKQEIEKNILDNKNEE